MNGARAVSRSWVEPAYRERLLVDALSAIAELDVRRFDAPLIVVENTPASQRRLCTLCSCIRAGLVLPRLDESPPYRARMVR